METKIIDHVPTKKVEILAEEICGPYTIKLRSDGIVHSHTSSSMESSIESLKKFNLVMGRMLGYNKAPLLITLDQFSIPPPETRDFWAKKESCPYALADAYVTANIGHKLIGNLYLKFNKPERPTRIFTKIEDAVEWLKTFR